MLDGKHPHRGACDIDVYPDSLEPAKWTVQSDVDLASATADVYLAGGWHALSWTGASVQSGSTWSRPAQIVVSGANPVTGVKPSTADAIPLVRVTVGGDVVIRPSSLRMSVKR